MSDSSHVRYSNDGDQYHYIWAARRCLRLLSAKSRLVAVSIEGPSEEEHGSAAAAKSGELAIDVGEYYGSEDIREAETIRYIQLKHSTVRATKPWTPSELKSTIVAFATRFQQLLDEHETDALVGRLQFCFRSNRPIRQELLEAVEDLASMATPRHPSTAHKLQGYLSLGTTDLSTFFQMLSLEGGRQDYILQRASLTSDVHSYLPGNDFDAPIQLKELVTRKALSENLNTPSIRRDDVLLALGTTEDELFPAPSRIAPACNAVPRVQEVDFIASIVASPGHAVIHAAGGVGKSVLSQRLPALLPEGSVAVVYDCYGNGEYRRVGSPRHRHKDALVQIANELAARGLCDPIVRSTRADPTDYMRAFLNRIDNASQVLTAKHGDAVLCVFVDAADCAELAAIESGEPRSFARDLLLESLPNGVRLVILSRTERISLLDPPTTVRKLELCSFAREESAALLRSRYPDASEGDIDEFHSLTSQNPRVQAVALAESDSLSETLLQLGPNPRSVDDTIAGLLKNALDSVAATWGSSSQQQIDTLCAALAILRPSIPMEVLAAIAGVDLAAVRSFVSDLGRPLLVAGDTVQFRDEPVETWFQKHYRPDSVQLDDFLTVLKPLASTSAYVASALPQLMLEAGQLSDLIDLALTSSSLPTNDPVARRNVSLQRLQFALRASLREKRFLDATRLALTVAKETAGEARQQQLIRDNTDLAAKLMDSSQTRELVAQRAFADWIMTRHAHEAVFLSFAPESLGEARSRLRMAHERLKTWSRLPDKERKAHRIDSSDIAEYALAILNLLGPDACAGWIATWRPRSVSSRIGTLLASRLVDHGAYALLADLASAGESDLHLLLAINQELRRVGRTMSRELVDHALSILTDTPPEPDRIDFTLVSALVESAYLHGLLENAALASLLRQYLPDVPPRDLGSRISVRRFALLRAYALTARLDGTALRLHDVAHPSMAERLDEDNFADISQSHREFKDNMQALLPWHVYWADTLLAQLLSTTVDAVEPQPPQSHYWHDSSVDDEIANIWFDSLLLRDDPADGSIERFRNWVGSGAPRIYIPTWIKLARCAARAPSLHDFAFEFSQKAYSLENTVREGAESKASTYVDIARALYALDESEARAYFGHAIDVVTKIGDEVSERWRSILDLAAKAADADEARPRLAYSLARRAEVVDEYVDRHFDWQRTVAAMADLCPSSCFAVLSRWRDRNIGWTEELLVTAVDRLVTRGRLSVTQAAVLVPFDLSSRLCRVLLDNIEGETDSMSGRASVIAFLLHYIRLNTNEALWTGVQKLAQPGDWHSPAVERLIAGLDNKPSAIQSRIASDDLTSSRPEAGQEADWDQLFSNCDANTEVWLAHAYSMYSQQDQRVFGRDQFYSELVSRVHTTDASEFIRAFAELPVVTFYDIQPFFAALPPAWRQRMTVQHSARKGMKELCHRFAVEIAQTRRWRKGLWTCPAFTDG